MAKDKVIKKAKPAKKPVRPSVKSDETIRLLTARLDHMTDVVEQLARREFYARVGAAGAGEKVSASAAQDRFVQATSDGWLEVLITGVRQPLPSGLKVSLSQTSGGRDSGIVSEGAFDGQAFDVKSGFLEAAYRRLESLVVKVVTRQAGPVMIGGVVYELEVTLTYREGGTAKSSGPFPAKTDADNPVPAGSHDLEIPDFPHPLGSGYGPYGMVWFRIGHSGDRYLHPGKVSLGCITCAPGNWSMIYQIVHAARTDSKSVGRLTFAP
jgi:hypothetical protein